MDGGEKVSLGQSSGITVNGSKAKVTLGGGTVELYDNAKINLGDGMGSSFTLKADTLTADGARNDGAANITGKGTLNLSTYSPETAMYVESAGTSSTGLHGGGMHRLYIYKVDVFRATASSKSLSGHCSPSEH